MAAALLSLAAMAQAPTGGIKAGVVDRAGRAPVAGATVELGQDGQTLDVFTTGEDGKFLFEGLADGNYELYVEADGYTSTRVNAKVEQGLVRNLMFVALGPAQTLWSSELDASNFAEFDLDDTGYSDAPTLLYATNDVYADMVGFGFSAIRFKNRGYASETQDVYLAGVPMNDALSGYTPFSLWSGLNEAMRSKDATLGLETLPYGAGGYNGLTNISGQLGRARQRLVVCFQRFRASGRQRLGRGSVLPLLRLLCRSQQALRRCPQTVADSLRDPRKPRCAERFHPGGL